MEALREQLYDEWTFVVPRFEQKYCIDTFDDGNEELQDKYHNEWIIFGEWKDKVALFNNQEPTVILRSISAWKITLM